MFRVYLSNIRVKWPVERQEATLAEAVPNWRDFPRFTDMLTASAKRRQGKLVERDDALLRQTGRDRDTNAVILVAALPVIAWTSADLISVLMRAAARHERLQSVADKMLIDPTSTNTDELRHAFDLAVKRFAYRGVSGGEASGAARHAAAMEKLERIKPYWPLIDQYSIRWICKEFDISRPTLLKYMPDRDEAAKRHKVSVQATEANLKRRKKGE